MQRFPLPQIAEQIYHSQGGILKQKNFSIDIHEGFKDYGVCEVLK